MVSFPPASQIAEIGAEVEQAAGYGRDQAGTVGADDRDQGRRCHGGASMAAVVADHHGSNPAKGKHRP